MNAPDVIASRLVGTWRSVLVSDEGEFGYFRILEDLRYVGILLWEPPGPDGRLRYVDMRLWGALESESVYRLKLKQSSEGWTRDVHFDGDILVMGSTGILQEGDAGTRKMEWRCRRLADQQIPEWFEPEFKKAMARPWL